MQCLVDIKCVVGKHVNYISLQKISGRCDQQPTGVVTSVATYSLMMTTTSHEICRISLKELSLYISRDSKTACDSTLP